MDTQIQLNELTSRDKLSRLKRDFKTEITDGNINPLEAAAILKAMEDFTEIRKDILVRDAIQAELERYPEKTVNFGGAVFQKKMVSVTKKYDDPVLRKLERQLEMKAMEVAERKKLIDAIPADGIYVVDDTTGEVCHVYPPVKEGKEGYAITLGDAPARRPQPKDSWFEDRYCDAAGQCYTDADPGL